MYVLGIIKFKTKSEAREYFISFHFTDERKAYRYEQPVNDTHPGLGED